MSNSNPKRWLPGVLNYRQVSELLNLGLFGQQAPGKVDLDPSDSAIDLHVGSKGYAMGDGVLKPAGLRPYEIQIERYTTTPLTNEPGKWTLTPGSTYVFEIREKIDREILYCYQLFGRATAKSSVGRIDVLARLIADYEKDYETLEPPSSKPGSGEKTATLWVELTPITFPVSVRPGDPIVQLRLFRGDPTNSEIKGEFIWDCVFASDSGNPHGDLTVDLTNDPAVHAAAFRRKDCNWDTASEAVPLSGSRICDPTKYWESLPPKQKNDNEPILPIKKDIFHILRSFERLELPGDVALYARAMDEALGEFRVHYAGFVHPWFGAKRDDGKTGAPLIFEVRGHNINVILRHQDKLARLVAYRMSEPAPQPTSATSYSSQELTLSKVFTAWPGTPS